jgi:hypothetical protein
MSPLCDPRTSATVSPHTSPFWQTSEHARQHLVADCGVVRVDQDDFVGLAAVDLAGVAQPNQVLGELAPVVLAHAGLAHHEGLEALAAQFLQHGGGGDVAVPL